MNKLKKEHKALDEQVKTLYNTTNSERTLKELKVKKSKLKDEITNYKEKAMVKKIRVIDEDEDVPTSIKIWKSKQI